jgi:pimeloyl-ACP methyl ester carboxylesterase
VEWAKLPRYYVMDLNKGMAETVAGEMPSPAEIAACRWLPDSDLRVYSGEYRGTGFQGGLNGYRTGPVNSELQVFAGRTIDVPSAFVGGRKDWGVYQAPGALERLEEVHTTKYLGTQLVDGAGHWVQQEQPEQTSALLVQFLKQQQQSRG